MTGPAAAIVMGLLGSVHCAAMCGGIAASLSAAPAPSRSFARINRIVAQNAGRLTSYAIAGALTASLGTTLASRAGGEGMLALRSMAALMMIAAGLQIGGWSGIVSKVEALGALLWKRLAPLAASARRLPGAGGAYAFGLVWGWLPCGLVYSALVIAATSETALAGSTTMLAFGLGTLPATLAIGGLAGSGMRALRRRGAPQAAGIAMTAFGAWTLFAAIHAYLQPAMHCH